MKGKDISNFLKTFKGRISDTITGKSTSGTKDFLLVLYIVIIILVNVVGAIFNFRVDLTENDTYSLSEKSQVVVSDLKENLKISVLFSKDLPAQHSAIYRYLRDLLEEYDYYGNEYFSYEIIDEKDLEKEAQNYGIRPVQSQEFANDQVRVRRTYMGIVIQQSDVIEKIEAVTDTKGLEYSITSLIEKMSGKIDGLLKLKDPITVSLYLDSNLKKLNIEGMDELEKKVEEAVARSNVNNYDKLKYELIDPSRNKDAALAAEQYGLDKLKWRGGVTRTGGVIEAGEAVIGIVLEAGDKFETIDLSVGQTLFGNFTVSGHEKLDDKLNDAVGRLVSANPKVGYITGHGEINLDDQQSREGGALMKKILSDLYDLKIVDLTKDEIPADLNLIIVNGPKKQLEPYEVYKIDQFLMKGKSAIFLVDSFAEMNMPGRQNMFNQQPMVLPINTGLADFFKHLGVTVNKDIVLDSSCAKVNLRSMIKDYPVAPIIKKESLLEDNVITKYLNGIAFFKASSISLNDDKLKKGGVTARKLVKSSDKSWLMTGRINFNPFYIMPPKEETMTSHTLAVLLSGSFESYFKGKDLPEDPSAKKRAGSIQTISRRDSTMKSGTSRVIILGTSEIAKTGFLMESKRLMSSVAQGGDEEVFSNAVFLHNIVDYLTGNTYVPEMRSKSLDYYPLDKLGDKTRFAMKVLNIGGIPVLVILFGIFIWRRRLNRKKKLQIQFSGEAINE